MHCRQHRQSALHHRWSLSDPVLTCSEVQVKRRKTSDRQSQCGGQKTASKALFSGKGEPLDSHKDLAVQWVFWIQKMPRGPERPRFGRSKIHSYPVNTPNLIAAISNYGLPYKSLGPLSRTFGKLCDIYNLQHHTFTVDFPAVANFASNPTTSFHQDGHVGTNERRSQNPPQCVWHSIKWRILVGLSDSRLIHLPKL